MTLKSLLLLIPTLLSHAQTPLFIDAKATVTGQWKGRETRTLDTLNVPALPSSALTRFGGLSDEKRPATGFFRVEKIADRWWLIDPEGGRFIFAGLCSLKPESQLAAKEPFEKLFGSPQAWAFKTLDLLRELRFNGCGGFSDHETLRSAENPLPYTVTLNLMSGFARSLGLTHSEAGHTGYQDDVLPVFEPGFEAF